ncbi:hypothetical protein KS4_24800 [Poriferisphaera corsica]|uniref:Uncharacterized protein n=1 Tax=Poriferisphaera corsica TaxID=2528020 RepID=A0A517YVZ8_9BACT|nr:hypothetical protein KS4_24800 [Poriferisphaera corsica]
MMDGCNAFQHLGGHEVLACVEDGVGVGDESGEGLCVVMLPINREKVIVKNIDEDACEVRVVRNFKERGFALGEKWVRVGECVDTAVGVNAMHDLWVKVGG